MKIRPEHLINLQKEQEARKDKVQDEAAFKNLLDKELGSAQKAPPASKASPSAPAAPLSNLDLLKVQSTSEPQPSDRSTVMDRIDTLLSRWDAYTEEIGSTPPDLRKADQVLDTISSEISTIRDAFQTRQLPDEMGSVLDELEILTVTERIKFNRGDYI